MQAEPTKENSGNMLRAANKQGSQGIIHLPHSWKLDQLLLLASFIQFALFVPLAWWTRRHPQPLVESVLTHTLQHKQPSLIRRIVSHRLRNSKSGRLSRRDLTGVLWDLFDAA